MDLQRTSWTKFLYLLNGLLNGLEVHNSPWIGTSRTIAPYCSDLNTLIGDPNLSGSLIAGFKTGHSGKLFRIVGHSMSKGDGEALCLKKR